MPSGRSSSAVASAAGGAGLETSGEGGGWVCRRRFEAVPFWGSDVWVGWRFILLGIGGMNG